MIVYSPKVKIRLNWEKNRLLVKKNEALNGNEGRTLAPIFMFDYGGKREKPIPIFRQLPSYIFTSRTNLVVWNRAGQAKQPSTWLCLER